jgi:hypothetical protein
VSETVQIKATRSVVFKRTKGDIGLEDAGKIILQLLHICNTASFGIHLLILVGPSLFYLFSYQVFGIEAISFNIYRTYGN